MSNALDSLTREELEDALMSLMWCARQCDYCAETYRDLDGKIRDALERAHENVVASARAQQ